MNLTSDQTIYWHHGAWHCNQTMIDTWVLMAVLGLGSWLITRRLVVEGPIPRPPGGG